MPTVDSAPLSLAWTWALTSSQLPAPERDRTRILGQPEFVFATAQDFVFIQPQHITNTDDHGSFQRPDEAGLGAIGKKHSLMSTNPLAV